MPGSCSLMLVSNLVTKRLHQIDRCYITHGSFDGFEHHLLR